MKDDLRNKTISATDAAAIVKSRDWVDFGGSFQAPVLFDRALALRKEELEGVRIRTCVTVGPKDVLECDPEGRHFLWFNWHFSAYDRSRNVDGRCNYIPMNFGESPDYYRRFLDPVDVACFRATPMDADGWFNFGATNAHLKAMTERAKVVIVETTRAMPNVDGEQNAIHISDVDHVIDGGDEPLSELPSAPVTDVDRRVAATIASQIENGACLQIGIGGMPNAVCATLKDAGLKDLGIHTEMFVDGMIDLIESGVANGSRKQMDVGKAVFTFALGSRRQYDFLDNNPAVRSYPVDYTNLPHQISRNDRVVSINNTTQIDLQGQAASESDGHRHLTGTGGQLQFVRGAYASKGGKSFVCLASTYERRGARRSRIVSTLTPGNIVTTPRTDMMIVVTEYGSVNLKGKSVAERATALIGLAHPDFREDLSREARELGLIPRHFW
ncbi:MAG: acetyl-CoA hydrolase/transferase family protein [Candidatus Binatia bacterium]